MDTLKSSRCALLATPGTVVSISCSQCWPLDEINHMEELKCQPHGRAEIFALCFAGSPGMGLLLCPVVVVILGEMNVHWNVRPVFLLHFPGMVVDRKGNGQFGPDSLQSVTVSHFHPFVFSAKRVCYVLGFIYCPLGVLVLLSTVHWLSTVHITPFFFLICSINLLSIITCLRFFSSFPFSTVPINPFFFFFLIHRFNLSLSIFKCLKKLSFSTLQITPFVFLIHICKSIFEYFEVFKKKFSFSIIQTTIFFFLIHSFYLFWSIF